MGESIERYAERLTLKRLRERNYCSVPAEMETRLAKIAHPGAVIWDVYGTLLEHSKGEFANQLSKERRFTEAFRQTAVEFGLSEYLDGDPAQALRQMYERRVSEIQKQKRDRGVYCPEVRIERVWLEIVSELETRGYRPDTENDGITLNYAFKIAYFFDMAEQPKDLYPGSRETLEGIRKLGLRQGIISNSQFYTPIALNILLRRAGVQERNPLDSLFDKRLVLFSYRLGVSKPNPLPFELARSRLESMGIERGRTVYVGNDLCNDMVPARNAGFRCVLFAGDRESITLRQDRPECVGFQPDAVIKSLPELLDILE